MPRGMLPVLALTLWTLYRYAPGVLSYASNGPGSCVQQGFSCQVAVWPLQAGRELSVLTAPRELVALTSGYHQAAVTYLQSAVESLWQYTRVSTAAALKVAMPLASLGWNPGLMLAVLVVVSTAALLFTAGLTPAQSQVPAQRAYSRAPQVPRQSQPVAPRAAAPASRNAAARLHDLERQARPAVPGNPGHPALGDQAAQHQRRLALERLRLNTDQMEALIPILDANRAANANSLHSIITALSNEHVRKVVGMPVFRGFDSVLKATHQLPAQKLAVATLLVLLRRTAVSPQARAALRTTLTCQLTAGTPWSTLNGRFFRAWAGGLSDAVAAAVGGKEQLARFKYANVAASLMLALLMSEDLVI